MNKNIVVSMVAVALVSFLNTGALTPSASQMEYMREQEQVARPLPMAEQERMVGAQRPMYDRGYRGEYRPVAGTLEGAEIAAEGVAEGTAHAVRSIIP